MKTKTTLKHTLLALTVALSIVSCKKDKKNDPDNGGGNPPVEVKAITLTDLKALSTGPSVKIPDAKKITGIVISDVSNKNIDSKTVVLQDAASQVGIILTFDAAQTFAIGDQLEVNISNQTLAQVNGEIEVTNVPSANAKKMGVPVTIAAKATTAADIITNKAAWDGTLVTLNAGSFSGGNGKYSGSLTYTDAAGAVNSNVLTGASFENTAYPAAVNSVTGIVRVNGNTVGLDIRNLSDVVANSTITKVITEDFSTISIDWKFGTTNPFTTDNLGDSRSLVQARVGYRKPLAGDEAFLQSQRNYLYLYGIGNQLFTGVSSTALTASTVFNGLKEVSITVGGSVFTGNPGESSIFIVDPFDKTKNVNRIDILLEPSYNVTGGIKVASFSFNDIGVSHTFTFKMPETLADMQALLTSLGVANPETRAPQIFNQNLILIVKNSSDVRSVSNTAPVVVQKIVYSIGN